MSIVDQHGQVVNAASAAEAAVHAELRRSLAHGREFYRPTPQVLAAVNRMRERFDLTPLIA